MVSRQRTYFALPVSGREEFKLLYGNPTDVSAVWWAREVMQDQRQHKRYIFRQLEDAMMFEDMNHRETIEYIRTNILNSLGIPRGKL